MKKRPKSKRSVSKRPSKKLRQRMAAIETLFDAGNYAESRSRLAELYAEFGADTRLLEMAAEMSLVMGDNVSFVHYAEALLPRIRGEEQALLQTNLATCYTQMDMAGLAHAHAHAATQSHPEFYLNEQNRNLVIAIQEAAADDETFPQLIDYPVNERLPLAQQIDQVRYYFLREDMGAAIPLAESFIGQHPTVLDMHNLLALMYFESHQVERAIEVSENLLVTDESNIPALANLVRFNVVTGQLERAITLADRLNQQSPDRPERYAEVIEANAFVGNHEQILKLHKQIATTEVMNDAFLSHIVAVANWHQGNEKRARKYWRLASEYDPGFELADYCLQQLPLPDHEQDLGWYYPLTMWIPRPLAEKLGNLLAAQQGQAIESAPSLDPLIELNQYQSLFPAMLARGNLIIRQVVLWAMSIEATADTIEALIEYGSSPAGPDRLRAHAIQLAQELQPERLPTGYELPFWHEGEQTILTLE